MTIVEIAPETTKFAGWAVLELMGHRRLAGFVTETELAGGSFLRLDVPGDVPATDGEQTGYAAVATQFYSPASVYCLTPCTEEAARAVAARSFVRPPALLGLPAPVAPAPVEPWELRECKCGHVAIAHSEPADDFASTPCRIVGCACGDFTTWRSDGDGIPV